MAKFRFVEAPEGVWWVEKKGWFFWNYLTFYYGFKNYYTNRFLTVGSPHSYGSQSSFHTLEEAEDALKIAEEAKSYRRVVYSALVKLKDRNPDNA